VYFPQDRNRNNAVRMNARLLVPYAVAAAVALTLAACTQPSAPSKAATKPAVALDHDPVGAIRAAGIGMDSAVQVQPLRDPAIEGLLNQAHAAETAKNYDAAADAAAHALALAPNAPDILQYQAELEIFRGHWKAAEDLAIKSFTLGPKVGSLCARNWQTVVEARIALKDPATEAQAKQRLKECRVAPPVRM
jgi:pyruvate/2-oxoglutarate dehydrogenase complex dihydrolipoamide acyltransferase (E2) component